MVRQFMKRKSFDESKDKIVSNYDIAKFGLSSDSLKMVEDLEELRKTTPNIIIAKCVKNITFIQNQFKEQSLKKNVNYIMSFAIYHQLFFDKINNLKILKPAPLKFKNLYKSYTGQDLTNKKLLVWRTGGIGDLLFIQPNLIYLKEKYPTCKIYFACGPQYQDMVKTWKCLDKVFDIPFSFQKLIDVDYHLVFEGVIERTKEAERINAYELFTKWMGLNLPNEKLRPSQNPDNNDNVQCIKVLEHWKVKKNDFLLIQMSASSPIRTPSLEVWKSIIDKLVENNHKIIITDSPKKSPWVEQFITTLKNKENVYNFAKYSTDIGKTIAMTELAKCVISTDSSLMHIAQSVDTKAFGIFGPFLGEIRLSTYKNVDWINYKNEENNCSPCFTHGNNPCKFSTNDGHSKCFNSIKPDEIIEKLNKLLIKEK